MADPNSAAQPSYQGQSNPPDAGNVSTISDPDDNDQTIAQSAAPNEPAAQPPSTLTSAPNTPQAGQNPSGSNPQAQPSPTGKTPDLSKPAQPSPQQAQQAAAQAAKTQAVGKASVFHDVAEALAGGPRYTYDVDAYGNMQKTKVPVSGKHLALAIAMEALGGAATGFANGQGPAGAAHAVGASFQQGEQQVQQRDQKGRQQASEDYTRRAQVLETNMRMYANARALGKQDADTIDAYIANYKDLVNKLQTEYPGYIKGVASYNDLQKYHVTMDNAIPYMRVARRNADGTQITDDKGVPQWDIDYLILDPQFKTSGLFTPDDLKNLKEMGQPWADNELVNSSPLNTALSLNKKAQASAWGVAHTTFDNFFDTLDEANGGASTGSEATTKAPKLSQPTNDLVDKTSAKYNVDPNMIKAIIAFESNDNPNAANPTSTAKGLMQLLDSTAAQVGVKDPFNPQQNVEGGTKLFSQLMSQYKDPRLALAVFEAGPNAVKDGKIVDAYKDGKLIQSAATTKQKVDSISGMAGLQPITPTGDKVDRPTMADYAKDHPTFGSDVEKFMGALNGTDGKYGTALQHLLASGQNTSAANVAAYLGGPDAIKKHDDYVETQSEIRKSDISEQRSEHLAASKLAVDTAAQQEKGQMVTSLETAKLPDNVLQLDPHEVITNLQGQGVTLPPEAIRDAMTIARYEAPLNIASNKLWFKDKSLNQQDMTDIVRTLNPTFNAATYDQLRGFETAHSPVSKAEQAASAAAYHLNDLLQLSDSIKNGRTNYPLLNKIENSVNYQTGGSDYVRLFALTNAINQELAKSLSGGYAPNEKEITGLMKNMTAANSNDQIKSLGKLYTDVLYGKIKPYDEQFSGLAGNADRHLRNVPSSFTNLVQHYGYDTPWAQQKQGAQQQQNQPQTFNPNDATQYPKLSKDGSIGMDANGNKFVVATGQPVAK